MKFQKIIDFNGFQFNPESPEQDNSVSFIDYHELVQIELPDMEIKTVDRYADYLGRDLLSIVHYCFSSCDTDLDEAYSRFSFDLKPGEWLIEDTAAEHGYSILTQEEFDKIKMS